MKYIFQEKYFFFLIYSHTLILFKVKLFNSIL